MLEINLQLNKGILVFGPVYEPTGKMIVQLADELFGSSLSDITRDHAQQIIDHLKKEFDI